MGRYKKVVTLMRTMGTVFFSIGLCMSLVTEWNSLNTGLILNAIGSVALFLSTILNNGMSKRNTND